MKQIMHDNQELRGFQSSYRSIFKATSLFGGVQFFQILVSIIKSKIIAVLLGPEGVGIQGLFQSAVQVIQSVTSVGLQQSAVRDVSEAYNAHEINRVEETTSVLNILIWITGLIGLVSVVILSPLLSKISFGNYDYAIPFAFLSLTLLFDQVCNGQKVILQGLRKLSYLAKASTFGSIAGLILCIPIYVVFRIEGIVPTLILTSFANLFFSWLFTRKIYLKRIHINKKQIVEKGRIMLKMGLALTIAGAVSLAYAFLKRGFIRYMSGIEDVGLFTAGFAILNTYVGMVLSAMGTDYYPRLSAVNHDNVKSKELVNQQAEIALLIMAPLLIAFLVFILFVIRILYSTDFEASIKFIICAVPGMFFKAVSWSIAFLFMAKGDSRLYMINEILATTLNFVLSIVGYYYYGLIGMGVAFTVSNFLYVMQVFLVARHFYSFQFSNSFVNIYLPQQLLLAMSFLVALLLEGLSRYIVGVIMILASTIYSINELEKRIHVKNIISDKMNLHGRK